MKRSERKRRASWIDVAFTLAISILAITGGILVFLSLKGEAASTPETKKNVSIAPIVIDTIDSNYPGIKIVTETSNDTYAPFAMQYPQSLHSSFNEKVAAYTQNAKKAYLTTMEENKQEGQVSPGELNLSFETHPHHSGNYSFVLVNTNYSGGANGTTEIRSFHLNPKTGKSITIQDIFQHDEKRLKQLANLVREKLFEDPAMSEAIFPVEATLHTEPNWDNFKNFSITNEEIIFYFDEYTIASGSAGVPIVSIPLIDLNNILAANFKLIEEDLAQTPPTENSEDETPEVEESVPETDTKPDESENGATESTEKTTKKVALTFDDGPDPKVTMQILETLKKYDAEATFFMLGSRVEYYPEIAKNVKEAGHELGNHTWNHLNLTKASVEKVREEINRTSSIIESVTGQKATAFRPPYGAANDTVRAQTDLPSILWDVDTLDWKHRNPTQLLSYVKTQTKEGSIILMHDIHQSTADGLDAILSYLKDEGYSFVKVSDLD